MKKILALVKVESGREYSIGKFLPNELQYMDRDYTFNYIPEELKGCVHILTCGNDKLIPENEPCFTMKAEHDVEVAEEGENLVVEILRQYLDATTQCYIEKDWESPKGERYRRVTFTPSFNMNVKFCLKATDEINNLITEACKPEWMKKAEQEEQQKEESGN